MCLIVVAFALLPGCGGEEIDAATERTERTAPPVEQEATAPPASSVPRPDGVAVAADLHACPVSPDRCIRRVIVVDERDRSDGELLRAQQTSLQRAGWRRVRVCGSDVVQYEHPEERVEVFVFDSRTKLREAIAADDGSAEPLRDALVGGESVAVLEIAEIAPGTPPPCS